MTTGTTDSGAGFVALSEPNRRAILDLLRERERPVGELVTSLGISQPLVSKHLQVLRNAGLVESRVSAQRRLYRVRTEGLAPVDAWLTPYRVMWSRSLDALTRHVEQMSGQTEKRGAPPRRRQ